MKPKEAVQESRFRELFQKSVLSYIGLLEADIALLGGYLLDSPVGLDVSGKLTNNRAKRALGEVLCFKPPELLVGYVLSLGPLKDARRSKASGISWRRNESAS